jgi:hydrogenase maturation protein HypF
MSARWVRVRGVVQGVGFRPFVYRLARRHGLTGWVLNRESGVDIHVEGGESDLEAFLKGLSAHPPPASRVISVEVRAADPAGHSGFSIRPSTRDGAPSVRIAPDLPVCDDCLTELFHPEDPRFEYPYINCTNCGPRYSIVHSIPYDRANTTMRAWPLDTLCSEQYHDPEDRRFHAQPVACGRCGPHYLLEAGGEEALQDYAAIQRAAALLHAGKVVALKGIGGYHLACNARDTAAVGALRSRKYRKEKPFALMARDLSTAREIVRLEPVEVDLITSAARPIVLSPAVETLEDVAPESAELGVMLPYTPLHHLLFRAGAPAVLVMTSGNRSSEPIAYEDDEARETLSGIADAFLTGERPIARRVDDSIARAGVFGPVILRRSRGYTPAVVATLPCSVPMLAVGADLKNAVALSASGEIIVSQHIGDLEHHRALQAFHETIRDLASMYEVSLDTAVIVHDAHPEYASSLHAAQLGAPERRVAVQHHRAHIASVLAEREEWDRPVLGIALDGTGYGDDGAIWGGEFFRGSIRTGFERIAHLRYATLPGGDAAARFPIQAAAGFLSQVDTPDLTAAPFCFPQRYHAASRLGRSGFRTFPTTSMGRLFDTVAALAGFIRPITFEGQAAMWLEQLARTSAHRGAYDFPLIDGELDFRPALHAIVTERRGGSDPAAIARAFHRGLGRALSEIIRANSPGAVALSGGVFQNELLLEDLSEHLAGSGVEVLINHEVPPNDGGICLGQIALAAFHHA